MRTDISEAKAIALARKLEAEVIDPNEVPWFQGLAEDEPEPKKTLVVVFVLGISPRFEAPLSSLPTIGTLLTTKPELA